MLHFSTNFLTNAFVFQSGFISTKTLNTKHKHHMLINPDNPIMKSKLDNLVMKFKMEFLKIDTHHSLVNGNRLERGVWFSLAVPSNNTIVSCPSIYDSIAELKF